MAKSPPSSVHSSCRKAGMKDWEAVPLPILSLTASYHLPIPCGLTGKYPCGKGKERSKAKSPYWEPRHRSWLPPSDDRLSITDPVALFREIGWLCHRRIFNGRGITFIGFCIDVKAVFVLFVTARFLLFKGRSDFGFQFIEQSGTEGITEEGVVKMMNIAPETVIAVSALRNKAMDVRVPF